MNRLLKFPRPKQATGRGYILGRVGRKSDSIDTHDSDDDIDGIYVDRRSAPHQTLYDQDNHSVVIGTTSSSDESNNDDQNAARSSTSGDSVSRKSYIQLQPQKLQLQSSSAATQSTARPPSPLLSPSQHQHQINIVSPSTAGSPKKATMHSSSSFTNLPKMTTRYRFRDFLLGDFSFNDDGERWVLFYFPLVVLLFFRFEGIFLLISFHYFETVETIVVRSFFSVFVVEQQSEKNDILLFSTNWTDALKWLGIFSFRVKIEK